MSAPPWRHFGWFRALIIGLAWLVVQPALAQLPPGWSEEDIGDTGIAGWTSYANGEWRVFGSGDDISGSYDGFHFTFQNTTNNVIVARVTGIQNTDGWAKAGVMFRENDNPSSAFADVVITSANGVSFQWRNTFGAGCTSATVGGLFAPVWVKLVRANNQFTAYYGPDGVAWTQLGSPQNIPMNTPQLAGLCVTSRSYGTLNMSTFTDVSVSYAKPLPPPPPPIFGVYRELWSGIYGGLNSLTNTALNPNWPDFPDSSFTTTYTNFETGVNTGLNNYGQRLRAFVVPPTNGDYTFWISSDDNSMLFLSSDEYETNKVAVAWVSGWTSSREWSKYPEQQSAPVPLEGGRRYYLEAIMQQGSGGDNLAVRWQLPDHNFEEPLPASSARGTRLVICTGVDTLPGIYQQTTNITVLEGRDVRMSVLVTNRSAVTYRWRLNGASLVGTNAFKPFYSLTNVSVAGNNGQVYTCGVTNSAGGVLSAPITLTVLRDTNPPVVLRTLNVGITNVQIIYGEMVEASTATNIANYHFTNGLAITRAILEADNATVTLTTAPLVYGSNYTILINNVRDRASIPNTIAANTPARFAARPYASEDIGDLSPPSITTFLTNGLDVVAYGADIGGGFDQFSLNYLPRTGNFDIGVRVTGLSLSDVWAKAGLMAREGLDPGARFAATLTTPTMAGSFFEWRDPAYSQANMSGRFPPNYPNAWLRLKRAGNTFTGYASYDGQTWIQLGSALMVMPARLYVGLVTSSHNAGQATIVQFRDIANLTNPTTGVVANPSEPLGVCSRRTPIVISEIMYKPAKRADTNNVEFIEVYNSNPYPEDISGFRLRGDNMDYTFPAATVLSGGAFAVVAASPQGMANVYGLTGVFGPYTGTLKASDTLQLLDEQGAILLTIPYSDQSPWPVAADGTGHSLVLARPTYGEGDPKAWGISDIVGGSPGQMEAFRPSPLRNVLINEFLAHTDPPDYDYIELYNHANQPVDVSGCILTDSPNTNKYVIPAGTIIPARGFVSFSELNMPFGLSSAGETVYFKTPDASRVLDAVRFGGQENGVAMGRWPDGANDWYRLTARTPGTNNASIRLSDVVINELMYHPISGNDDDQYIELYNRSTSTVNLGMWQLQDAVSYTFPSNTLLLPDSYLVIAANADRLRANYPNLTAANCLGNFSGVMKHKGERVALAMPHYDPVTNGSQVTMEITMYITVNEVTYRDGGRWGRWSGGGGSSLELTDPNSNTRLAYNWADSDETQKSTWTNIEFTGVLDHGYNFNNGVVDYVQFGLQEAGECLVDNVEVRPGGTAGPNIVANSDFEAGINGWLLEGDHQRSSLETLLPGYGSPKSLHVRASDGLWTLGDSVMGPLTQTTLGEGATATLRLKARWLCGSPFLLMRLRGNWLDVSGELPVPANLGTPGMRNSRYTSNAGPAIYEVRHSPALPAADEDVIVTARFHDASVVQPTLKYRIDVGPTPNPVYTSVPMVDNGTGGDAIARDGLYSARIPGQAAGWVGAFIVQARDALGVTTIFPEDLKDNSGLARECVFGFGDPIPAGSFSHHHLFITANWAERWAEGGGNTHELSDCTWIDGGGRIVYNWRGRYAGSPYHQYLGSPVTTIGGAHWIAPEDDRVFGVASLNKQHVPGNGALDDNTLQREQTSYWMAHQIGLQRQNRRYYVYYVNGNRHGPLMEDAQTPGADVLDEYFPDDTEGWLYKNHIWPEGSITQNPDGYRSFENESWCTLGKYMTSIDGLPRYKTARYRWMWWVRQYPDSPNNFSNLWALIDAANTPTNSPDYYANMEAQVDTEEWLRWSAIEHATGDWDSWFTQNAWNMYCYKPTRGKWTAIKWDWNITLGSGTQTWPADGSQLFNAGSYDPTMAAFHAYPPYRRAYLRALQDIANLAMNNALVDPQLDAKYAAFAANGLTAKSAYGLLVQEPGAAGLKSWIGTMHNSILAALTNQGVMNVSFAVTSTVVSNNMAFISGTAPIGVKAIWFNDIPYPITWKTVTAWTATVPLQPGSNPLEVVGVDLHNQPVPGSATTVSPVYNGTLPSPAGQVVINEIMYHALLPGAEYVELYNTSSNITYDLSNWRFNGLAYTFPPGSFIGPNSRLLLTANRSAYSQFYGGTMPLFDAYDGKLQLDGETLTLIKPDTNSADGLVVDKVRYNNAVPWPTAANTPGTSLQLVDASQDHWRVANWMAASTNMTAPPQWVCVTVTGTAASSSFLMYLQSAGDIYLDDLKLVSGSVPEAGANLLANGDFESAFPGPWTVSANLADSTLNTVVRHGGGASLHLVASAGGTGTQGSSIWQTVSVLLNHTYTLSFWYLQSPNGGPLTLRLTGAGLAANVNPAPPAMSLTLSTPGAANSVATHLAAFPPLWINEIQAENLTGITNSAGHHAPWIELFNPTTNTVSLNGIFLANNFTNLIQWPFPANAVINPRQFKVIFADGRGDLSTLNELHTTFALPSGAGTLALTRQTTNAQLQVLDYLTYTNLRANYSFGSFPDAQIFYRQEFFYVTPAATNIGTSQPITVRINEWMAANTSTVIDPVTGKYSDWFELYNYGTNPANLTGFYLSDDSTDRTQFRIPSGYVVPPQGFLLVWADGKDTNGTPELHVTFKLDKDGESLGLYGADGQAVDFVSYGVQADDVSMGRFPDGSNDTYTLARPTPGTNNVANTPPTLDPIADASLLLGDTLSFYASASDSDEPPQTLTFSLGFGAPAGASIDPFSGLFTWRPDTAGNYLLTVVVTDDGTPSLSASRNFGVTVYSPSLVGMGLSGNLFTFGWSTLLGKTYQVEYRNSLLPGPWVAYGDPVPGTGGVLTVTVDVTTAPRRYYRVKIMQ